MKTHLIIGLRLTFITLVIFGIIYPMMITGLAKIIGPNGGDGAKITIENKIVGFERIGQSFQSSRYFNGRPSAVQYNAASAGGSNKGINNAEYLKQVEERITDVLSKNPDINRSDIPVDLVTASGGGLDPDISSQSANIQISRIAKERNLSKGVLQKLVDANTERPIFNLMGTSRVNVLRLNLALDKISHP